MSRTLLGNRGPSDLSLRAGQRSARDLLRTVSAMAIITVSRAASAAGVGAIIDGEAHSAILGRMTDLGAATTSGAGAVAASVMLLTSGGDPVAAGDVLSGIRIVRSAAGARNVSETVGLDATVRAATIAFTQAPSLGPIRAGDRPADVAVDAGIAAASNGRPVTIAVELARGGADFAGATRWATAPAVKGEAVRARFTATAQGADAAVADVQTTVLAAIAPPASDGRPVNVEVPALAPVAAITGETLRLTGGIWTGDPSAYDRRWMRDGAVIESAAGTTYVPSLPDEGKTVTASIRALNAAGWSDWALATGATAVSPAPIPTGPIAFDFADQAAEGFEAQLGRLTFPGGGVVIADTTKGSPDLGQLMNRRFVENVLYRLRLDAQNTAGNIGFALKAGGHSKLINSTSNGVGRREVVQYLHFLSRPGSSDKLRLEHVANAGTLTIHGHVVDVAPVLAGPNIARFDLASTAVAGSGSGSGFTYAALPGGQFRLVRVGTAGNGNLKVATPPEAVVGARFRLEYDIERESDAGAYYFTLHLAPNNYSGQRLLELNQGNARRFAGAEDFTVTAAGFGQPLTLSGIQQQPDGATYLFRKLTVKAL